MQTLEILNKKEVLIEWDFTEIVERHDSNWCVWTITGHGSNGNNYQASCQADGTHPELSHDTEITDIEQI